jgi:outer membrane protein insertion porin family
MNRHISYPLMLCIVLSLAGCTGMKHISPEDPLYTGVEISMDAKRTEKRTLLPVINGLLKPEPNHQFLWMRPALARYNMLSDSARIKKFWKNKVMGPVLLSQANPQQVSAAIADRMFHQGYFHNTVAFDTVMQGGRKAKYKYMITLHEPFTIASVTFPQPHNDLTQKIYDSKDESFLKPGDIYTFDAVKNERARIDRDLKEKGYIYFSPDFILLKVDSVTGEHQVRTEITLKPETPPESRQAFTIRKVYVHDDHILEATATDTLQFGNNYLISRNHTLTYNALQQGLFLKPGELYSRLNYMHTIRYFNDLPIMRNANVKFLPYGDTDSLDVMLYLSQRKRFAYTAEFNTIFRSTNYFGPGVIFSYTDRNANKGAEMLKINLRGSFEMQIVDGEVNPAYELGVNVNYTLPRFFPTFLFNTARKSLPKTTVSAGYNLFNRLDLYKLNSITTNFGYSWSKTDYMQHSFKPLEVSFTKLPEDSKSQEFEDYLEENPGVQRSFDEQFILGMGYEFTYQRPRGGQSDFFFRGGIDLAGNVLNILYSATNSATDTFGRYTLFGVPFSQYLRPRMDLHYTVNINDRSKLASRLSTGVGIPIGNSDILPYIKQFYVGGTNSLRSFIARSVGPGSEVPPEGYNDVTGDIRLEGNLEYRFDISGSLKGALFLDAGNIWLFNEDPSRPNGDFNLNTFVDEIAMSYGWGLRWDFDFIVARLDFAYTLRTPYLPEGERWSAGFSFWDPALNIAIGYPF